MLGQMSLFPPKQKKLKHRVQLQVASLADVRGMLEQYHYLHRVRTGRQLNYLILIDGIVDGIITFAYPMVIGKIAEIPTNQVLEFARLWLMSNIPHSASCAIGKSLRRIRQDWQLLFPDAQKIIGVVSWSDRTRHAGTIYKAANFQHLHITKTKNKTVSGWGTNGYRKDMTTLEHDDFRHEKDCWIYKWA